MTSYFRILDASGGIAKWQEIVSLVFQMLDNQIDSPYLLSFVIDYYEEILDGKVDEESLKKALEVIFLWHSLFLNVV